MRILVAVVFAFSLGLLSAQIDRGSVTGTVFDGSGATEAAPQLEIWNVDTGFSQRTASSGAGVYTFVRLPLGRYRLSATMSGFKTWKITGFPLSVGEIRKLDIPMEIASQEAVVQLRDIAPAIDQTSAQQGMVV